MYMYQSSVKLGHNYFAIMQTQLHIKLLDHCNIHMTQNQTHDFSNSLNSLLYFFKLNFQVQIFSHFWTSAEIRELIRS